jgi:23S rRNA U2552 (ribose-2'-O)-methylase RlmE/FtsJ
MIYKLLYSDSYEIESSNLEKYHEKLSLIKSKIDKYPNEWDKIKRIINDYEYIYISHNRNKNISKIVPISRSFFKLTEMIHDHQLITNENKKCFCIAEAPGGFIQSLLRFNNITDIYGITLISDNSEIPHWNTNILKENKVKILKGVNKNGDICDIKNVLSVINELGHESIDFITGDGGFDYSSDYNKQEYNSIPLIYSEIFLSLNIQKKNGTFICKIFDIFNKTTIQLIYILSKCYHNIFFHKPSISRISNSEKYIICIGYKGYNKEIINDLIRNFNNPYSLDIMIDSNFEYEICKFNEYYIDNQINQINKGIHFIEKKLYNKPNKDQIKKAIKWCDKYKIPINKECFYYKKYYD